MLHRIIVLFQRQILLCETFFKKELIYLLYLFRYDSCLEIKMCYCCIVLVCFQLHTSQCFCFLYKLSIAIWEYVYVYILTVVITQIQII